MLSENDSVIGIAFYYINVVMEVGNVAYLQHIWLSAMGFAIIRDGMVEAHWETGVELAGRTFLVGTGALWARILGFIYPPMRGHNVQGSLRQWKHFHPPCDSSPIPPPTFSMSDKSL